MRECVILLTRVNMAEAKRRIVVIGATGRQGGATARRLKDAGCWEVVAGTRDLTSAPAQALAAAGFALVKLDCVDKSSLIAAFQGAYGVFGVTNPFTQRWTGSGTAVTDTDSEVVQGKNIVDACRAANVAHLVFASVAAANANSGVPTFEAKWAVEKYLTASGQPHTVLGPVGFLENMESS